MTLAVFYYPWYGGANSTIDKYRHWKSGYNGATHNPPTTYYSYWLPDVSGVVTNDAAIRLYDSFDQAVVKRQMDFIKQAHIECVIWSWFGKDTYSDKAMAAFWNSPNNPAGLKHCIYYERRWDSTVTEQKVLDDINYVKTKYAVGDKYMKVNGKPVVFVYNIKPPTDTLLNLAKKWKVVRDKTGIHTNLKEFPGWQDNRSLADCWHQYTPTVNYYKTVSTSGNSKYSSFVSPGFWKKGQTDAPRLSRDLNRFKNDLIKMKNDGTGWKLLETWNEWPEGTGLEPATNVVTNENIGTTYINAIASVF
jgi:hypothetical protein